MNEGVKLSGEMVKEQARVFCKESELDFECSSYVMAYSFV